jgi:hypothetical protein
MAEPVITPMMDLTGFVLTTDFADIVATKQMFVAYTLPLRGAKIIEVSLAR